MRAWALWAGCLLSACTRAPAPCGADVDCPAARCVNGACVSDAPPLDGGIAIDGGRLDRGVDPDDGVPRDDGPRDDGPRDDGPRDGGPRDAEPLIDAAPGCEFLMVTVDVDAGALEVRRDEPVELRVTATGGATITYESSAGGAFIDEPTGALWIARDEVDWPWFTDRVSLTVTAELDGCRAQQRVFVTLLGDVLVADVVSGRLDVIGSDGFEFGQWRLVDQSGVSALARMPDGGFVAAIRGPLDERGLRSAPRILRLDANGQEVLRFEPFDLMRAPIFTGQIEHLYVQGERVIAANVADDTIRWFDFEGELRRSVAGGGSWIEALAPRGDDNDGTSV